MSFYGLITKKAEEEAAAMGAAPAVANPSVNLLNVLTAESAGNSIQGAHSSNLLGSTIANPGGSGILNSANTGGDNDMDADDGAMVVKAAAYDLLMNTQGVNQQELLSYAKLAYANINKQAGIFSSIKEGIGNAIQKFPGASTLGNWAGHRAAENSARAVKATGAAARSSMADFSKNPEKFEELYSKGLTGDALVAAQRALNSSRTNSLLDTAVGAGNAARRNAWVSENAGNILAGTAAGIPTIGALGYGLHRLAASQPTHEELMQDPEYARIVSQYS